MSLRDDGFRFLHFGGSAFNWAHPLDGRPFVKDCTDLSEEEFEAYVLDVTGQKRSEPAD